MGVGERDKSGEGAERMRVKQSRKNKGERERERSLQVAIIKTVHKSVVFPEEQRIITAAEIW